MWNYNLIDSTPTLSQVKAIVQHFEKDPNSELFNYMAKMTRPEPLKVILDLNNAHQGFIYEVSFNEENEIISFKNTDNWIS